MTIFIAGLIIFFGVHSVRMLADDWRTAQIARMGPGPWKGAYTVASLVGFALLVWGYGLARGSSMDLWSPPQWTHWLTAALTLPAFVLFAAVYVKGTRIKAAIGHPMIVGTKTWALAHLLSNGRLADVLLFGAFLVWSVLAFRAARSRDRKAGVTYPALGASRDAIAIVAGAIGWAVFALFLHGPLIGVPAFG